MEIKYGVLAVLLVLYCPVCVGVVMRLIHSPFHNPKATVAILGSSYVERSESRFEYLAWRTRISSYKEPIVSQRLGLSFMALVIIGDPPFYQYLMIDTASSLTWLQCKPCLRCFQETIFTMFDPSESTSFSVVDCRDPLCSFSSPVEPCHLNQSCKFITDYSHRASAMGFLATETFISDASTGYRVTDMVIGCVTNNHVDVGEANGLLGLGDGNFSLVSRLGSRFSYCIGSIQGIHSNLGWLMLGDEAKIAGEATTLEVGDGLYYLTAFSGISLGVSALDLEPGVFNRSSDMQRGVILDSGTTLTYMASGAYWPLRYAVMELLDKDGALSKVENGKRLCYIGDLDTDLSWFPLVTFHFDGGAQLQLDTNSLFFNADDSYFCMSVEESSKGGVNTTVIGVMAQQGYNLGFDLTAGKISFDKMDCSNLTSLVT